MGEAETIDKNTHTRHILGTVQYTTSVGALFKFIPISGASFGSLGKVVPSISYLLYKLTIITFLWGKALGVCEYLPPPKLFT